MEACLVRQKGKKNVGFDVRWTMEYCPRTAAFSRTDNQSEARPIPTGKQALSDKNELSDPSAQARTAAPQQP